MASWIRCDSCRKVLPSDSFEPPSPICRACQAGPAPKARTTRASAVKTVRAAAPVAERAPLTGVAGSGDLEVRERRARRTATAQLVELHPADFEALLAAARKSEGLRS